MTSIAQAEAARANGAFSNGPKTIEGKANSAGNSIRHGLCSANFRLDNPAEQAAFEHLQRDLMRTWAAVDEAQRREVEQMAIATWRQGVVANVEQALWRAVAVGEACAEAGGEGLPSINAINRYRGRIERDLKLAKANLKELQAQRVKAVEAELAKAKEFNSLTLLGANKEELGEEAFGGFRDACTNEPSNIPQPDSSTPQANRPTRRRAEKLARKQKQRR